jgi:hypothetical protein
MVMLLMMPCFAALLALSGPQISTSRSRLYVMRPHQSIKGITYHLVNLKGLSSPYDDGSDIETCTIWSGAFSVVAAHRSRVPQGYAVPLFVQHALIRWTPSIQARL